MFVLNFLSAMKFIVTFPILWRIVIANEQAFTNPAASVVSMSFYSNKTSVPSWTLPYLDNGGADCFQATGNYVPLNTFHFVAAYNPNSYYFTFTCNVNQIFDSGVTVVSKYNEYGNSIKFLDRQDADCGDGYVMVGFTYDFANGYDSMRVKMTCAPTLGWSCVDKKSGDGNLEDLSDGNQNLNFLDRWTPSCDVGDALQQFQLVTDGTNGYYKMKCCSLSPTSQPSKPPTALPTPFPSVLPTANPSVLPTSAVTDPTFFPSFRPSALSTLSPTKAPVVSMSYKSTPTKVPDWHLSYLHGGGADCFEATGNYVPLNSFHFVAAYNPNSYYFNFECNTNQISKSVVSEFSDTTEYFGHTNIIYLDRQNADCGENFVMVGFYYDINDDTHEIQVAMTCAPVDRWTCRDNPTGSSNVEDRSNAAKNLNILDRWTPSCSDGEAIQRFQFVTNGKNSGSYEVKCCSPSPTSQPSTPYPSAPPTAAVTDPTYMPSFRPSRSPEVRSLSPVNSNDFTPSDWMCTDFRTTIDSYCDEKACLPGLKSYLGRGFDITVGSNFFSRDDPVKQRVFDFDTIDNVYTIRGRSYSGPSTTEIEVDTNRPTTVSQDRASSYYNSIKSYSNSMSFSLGADVANTINAPAFHDANAYDSAVTSSVGVSGSFTKTLNTAFEKNQESVSYTGINEGAKYTLLQTGHQYCAQHPYYKLDDLQYESEDSDKFDEFVEAYGTHVITAVSAGGYVAYNTQISSCTSLTSSYSSRSVGIETEYYNVVGGFSTSETTTSTTVFSQTISRSQANVCGGNSLKYETDGFHSWGTLLFTNDDDTECGFDFSLIPIYMLAPTASVRIGLEKAVLDYTKSKTSDANLGTNEATCPSPSSGASAGISCFSKDDTVQLISGQIKKLSSVEIGDVIMVADAGYSIKYSPVIALPHGPNRIPSTFLEITTEKGYSIKMTFDHFVPITHRVSGKCPEDVLNDFQLVKAKEVDVSMCILTTAGMDLVHGINYVEDVGVYLVITMEEFIVVNGIIASPYSVSHYWSHKYYYLHRLIRQVVPTVLSSQMFLNFHTAEIQVYESILMGLNHFFKFLF